jgi:hypothetical protein
MNTNRRCRGGCVSRKSLNLATSYHAALVAASSDSGRADQRNHLAFVPTVNAKILVGCDYAVVWIKLAHPDQTKIRQIWLPIRIALG